MKEPNLCRECLTNFKAPGRSLCFSCYGKARRAEAKPILTTPSEMRLLFLDIETAPNLCWTWDIWNANIGVSQIVKPAEMLCLGARWYGDDTTMFFSSWGGTRLDMIQAAWTLLDEADVVCHYYGSQFDIKHLNREFLMNGFPPPTPFRQVDLKLVASKMFKFTSNKLQFVSTVLGLEGKEEHEGFLLWDRVMQGDPDARERMRTYNIRDVELLEECFEILLPWIPNLPHRHLYDGTSGCPGCGASSMRNSGWFYTKMSRFPQYTCQNCGGHFRSTKRELGVALQASAL